MAQKKNTKPVIDMTPRLRQAADYLHKHGWTIGTEKDRQGRVCLTGAIRYCAPQTGDEYLIREVLRKRGRAESWNDRGATAEQVEGYLRTAEIADADLMDTFGPEWQTIVALVRNIAALETKTVIRLGAAWGAAWDAAWDAARGAATRDLIGTGKYTQAHYDLLTGPWRKAVGKLHPDDLDIYEPDVFSSVTTTEVK